MNFRGIALCSTFVLLASNQTAFTQQDTDPISTSESARRSRALVFGTLIWMVIGCELTWQGSVSNVYGPSRLEFSTRMVQSVSVNKFS